jgi:hypothetical protein
MLASHSAPGDKLDVVREEALEAIAAIEQNHAPPTSLAAIKELKINVGSQQNWTWRNQEIKCHHGVRHQHDSAWARRTRIRIGQSSSQENSSGRGWA